MLTVQSRSALPILATRRQFSTISATNPRVNIDDYPCTVFPPAWMPMRFSQQARSTLPNIFGVPFHVVTPRGDRLRRFLFFVLCVVRHFGGASALVSMVIHFCFSLGATQTYILFQQRVGSSRLMAFRRNFLIGPTLFFHPSWCRPHTDENSCDFRRT